MRTATLLAALLLAPAVEAQNAAVPGPLVAEQPTLHCLGVHWLIGGDANANARVDVAYRRSGATTWRQAESLFRVFRDRMRTPPPSGQVMHAGSIFGLDEDTPYDVRLSLVDPDGGSTFRVVPMRTWTEPRRPPGAAVRVKPGGLAAALQAARPGDVLELEPGVYRGAFAPVSGTPGQPIAIVGPADRSAVLDGGNGSAVLSRPGLTHVIFENLTVQNAKVGMAFNEGAHITVRRCTIRDVEYGFVATRDGTKQQRILIADNLIAGRATWPRTQGIENRRGVQVGGTGHVVCHNRIRGFADAIDVYGAYPTAAIDFYRNEISECTDDGIEMDYSERNTRCFENRLTNVYQGISLQPVHGGPVYVFRNTIYNLVVETFKLHNQPAGGVLYHNTSVKVGMPLVLYSSGVSVYDTRSRNNLLIGTTGNYAFEATAKMVRCDYDHDAFGGTWTLFLKWNGVRYKSIEEVRKSAPVYKNVVRVDPASVFQSGLRAPASSATQFPVSVHDTRLRPSGAAIDAGDRIAGINDGFTGKAPDIGAHELGAPVPHYGPRPVRAVAVIDGASPRPGSDVDVVLTTEGDGSIPYQMASSFGTGPLVIDTRRLGLSPDGLFAISLGGLQPTLFEDFAGTMSAFGRATATIHLPNLPVLAGLTIHSAFVTLDARSPSGIRSISNTASFRIAAR
jgi:hypothetical protein